MQVKDKIFSKILSEYNKSRITGMEKGEALPKRD
jgi:hypothetical protein